MMVITVTADDVKSANEAVVNYLALNKINYTADAETLKAIEAEGRVLFRYTDPRGNIDLDWNHNGAANAIAGVLNARGNVLGMMPHPENHVEGVMGNTDGRGLFAGLNAYLEKAA